MVDVWDTLTAKTLCETSACVFETRADMRRMLS